MMAVNTGERRGDAQGLVDDRDDDPTQDTDAGADDVGVPPRLAQET